MPTGYAARVFEPRPEPSAPPEGPEFLTRALDWIRRAQPPPTPMATAVFPEIRRDPFWEVMKGPMTEAGTPGASRIVDPGSEAGATGMQPPPAGWRERLGQLATFAGNALPFRGALRAPLLQTKAKYLHPKTGEEPTRVYHGTSQTFREFDPVKADPYGLYGPGFYHTENPKVAAGYALEQHPIGLTPRIERATAEEAQDYFARVWGRPGEVVEESPGLFALKPYKVSANIRPAHLDIRNPFDIERRMEPDEVRRLLTEAGHPMAQTPKNLEGYVKSNLTGEGVYGSLLAHLGSKDAVNAFLQRAGYDGITHAGGKISGGEPHRVWIAFSPEQVISPFEYARSGQLADAFTGGRPPREP
jgi:hypothetical protein